MSETYDIVREDRRMTMTVEDVLDELRQAALSEADKGTKFERLVKAFGSAALICDI